MLSILLATLTLVLWVLIKMLRMLLLLLLLLPWSLTCVSVGPWQCPGGTFTPGLRSTKEFSDEAVNFVRAHPLMYQPVYPLHRRPLVLSTAGDHRFTSIAVDIVDATDGKYEVLFLGTGE